MRMQFQELRKEYLPGAPVFQSAGQNGGAAPQVNLDSIINKMRGHHERSDRMPLDQFAQVVNINQ